MKDSNEWVRQQMVDNGCEAVLAERQCDIAEVKPYWVAEKLGCEANGAFYEKVRDWRKRAEAERADHVIEIPAQALTELRDALDRANAEMVATFTRAVRAVGGDLDRAASMRVVDAERRRDQAEAEYADVLALCRRAEDERSEVQKRVGELEAALKAACLREERLLGRLEQRDAQGRNETPPHPEKAAQLGPAVGGVMATATPPAAAVSAQPAIQAERLPSPPPAMPQAGTASNQADRNV